MKKIHGTITCGVNENSERKTMNLLELRLLGVDLENSPQHARPITSLSNQINKQIKMLLQDLDVSSDTLDARLAVWNNVLAQVYNNREILTTREVAVPFFNPTLTGSIGRMSLLAHLESRRALMQAWLKSYVPWLTSRQVAVRRLVESQNFDQLLFGDGAPPLLRFVSSVTLMRPGGLTGGVGGFDVGFLHDITGSSLYRRDENRRALQVSAREFVYTLTPDDTTLRLEVGLDREVRLHFEIEVPVFKWLPKQSLFKWQLNAERFAKHYLETYSQVKVKQPLVPEVRLTYQSAGL